MFSHALTSSVSLFFEGGKAQSPKLNAQDHPPKPKTARPPGASLCAPRLRCATQKKLHAVRHTPTREADDLRTLLKAQINEAGADSSQGMREETCWMDELRPHHFETMVETICFLGFAAELSCQGFLGLRWCRILSMPSPPPKRKAKNCWFPSEKHEGCFSKLEITSGGVLLDSLLPGLGCPISYWLRHKFV